MGWRARNRSVRAEDAALPRFGAQQRSTAAAFVEKPAGVGRHGLEFRGATPRTRNQRLADHQLLSAEGAKNLAGSTTIPRRLVIARRGIVIVTRFLQYADGVFIAQVARLEQIPEQERLNPEAVIKAIGRDGRPAFYEENADAIVDRIVPMLRPNDVVAVFSNGGFDRIHEKLLERLAAL